MLVTGQIGVNELSGPVGIVSTVDTTYKESRSYGVFAVVVQMLNMAILLSANLGGYEFAATPGIRWGTSGISFCGGNQRKTCATRERGICTSGRNHTIDVVDGICNV